MNNSTYTNDGDMGLTGAAQGGIRPENSAGGILHDIKEGVKEGVQDVKDGMSKLSDKITNDKDHDHLSSKIEVEQPILPGFGDNQKYGINNQ